MYVCVCVCECVCMCLSVCWCINASTAHALCPCACVLVVEIESAVGWRGAHYTKEGQAAQERCPMTTPLLYTPYPIGHNYTPSHTPVYSGGWNNWQIHTWNTASYNHLQPGTHITSCNTPCETGGSTGIYISKFCQSGYSMKANR